MKKYKPVALFILDGWGIRENASGNAIIQANTPNIDNWQRCFERSILDASGEAVGLAFGQMGNSEVGHLNIGAGRIVYQDITRIDNSISDGSFYELPTLVDSIENVKKRGKKLHLFGLLGPGGVHSHTRHLYALLDLANQHEVEPIIHVITDGRDTPPNSGIGFIRELEEYLRGIPGVIATVIGRYYAMDRDKRWERIKQAYNAYVNRIGVSAATGSEAISLSYDDDISDEFIRPTIINHPRSDDLQVSDGDCLVFFNFRADRMRQIVKSFVLPDFEDFTRKIVVSDLDVVTFTEYEKNLPVEVVFQKNVVTNPLAEVISKLGLKQFHSAETEKYSHVTFFLNGGREEPFDGEERFLVPSPKVATYDLKPEMSAHELTEAVDKRINKYCDDFIVVNYANMDMVGHTGILSAAIKAAETVDECVGKLVETVTRTGGVSIVTSDHGNAETMLDQINKEPHTYHTTNPVSLFVISEEYFQLRPRGILADVAPTVLDLMGISKSMEMTGRSLIEARSW